MGKETQSVAGILTGGFLPKYDVVLRFLTILSCGLKNTQGVLCALINANTSPLHPVSSASKSYLDHEIKVTLKIIERETSLYDHPIDPTFIHVMDTHTSMSCHHTIMAHHHTIMACHHSFLACLHTCAVISSYKCVVINSLSIVKMKFKIY